MKFNTGEERNLHLVASTAVGRDTTTNKTILPLFQDTIASDISITNFGLMIFRRIT